MLSSWRRKCEAGAEEKAGRKIYRLFEFKMKIRPAKPD